MATFCASGISMVIKLQNYDRFDQVWS